MRRGMLAAGLSIPLLLAGPAAAQEPAAGTVELGGFGQYVNFDAEAGCPCEWPMDDFGYGARAGYFLGRRLHLELDGATVNAPRAIVGGRIRYTSAAARLNVDVMPAALGGDFSFLAGLGPVLTRYGDGPREWGASGLAGARWHVTDALALRVDGVADYMPGEENLNLMARAGISVLLRTERREYLGAAPAPEPPVPSPAPVVAEPEPLPAPAAPQPPEQAVAAAPVTPTTLDAGAWASLTAPVFFDFDRADLRDEAIRELDRKAELLLANPNLRVVLEGSADDRGTGEYNARLGMRRAEAVRDYLVARGVPADRLETVSYGSTRLHCATQPADEACHQLNRRVDFVVRTPPPLED